jgi:ABC-type microcin C transport system permease subunit YejB
MVLWFIVAVVFFAIAVYTIGRSNEILDTERGSFLMMGFVGSFLWPIVLTVVIVGGPFFGLFWLGDRKRREQLKKKEVK